MKKFLFLLLLIAAIAAAVPFGGGYYFKQNYLALISNMNSVPQWPQVRVVSYEMGWLSSHVKLEITPTQSEPDARFGNLNFSQVTVDQTIKHGPVIFNGSTFKLAIADVVSNIHLPAPIEQILVGNRTDGIAQVNSLIGIDGNWSDKITAPAFTVKQQGIGELKFNGMDGDFTIQVADKKMQSIYGNIKIGEIKITSDKVATQNQYVITIKPITINNEAVLDVIGLWSGKGSLNMPEMSLEVDGSSLVSILNLGVATSMDLNGGNLYSMGEKISLDMVKIPGVIIPEVGPAMFKFDIKNVNAKALLAFLDYTNELSDQNGYTGQLSKDQEAKMLGMALKLIDPSTQITVHMSGNTSDGAFLSDAVASWKNGAPAPGDLDSIKSNTVFKFTGKIAAPLFVKLVEKQVGKQNKLRSLLADQAGKALQEQPQQQQPQQQQPVANNDPTVNVDMQEANPVGAESQAAAPQEMDATSLIGSWIAEGIIKQEGNDYVIAVEYKDGVVIVNGKPMQALK